MSEPNSLEHTISSDLNARLFLDEFTFPKSTFPHAAGELELADAVVRLGDTLIVEQIKERLNKDDTTENAERRWFQDKVLGKGTKQIRDTLRYLEQFPEIRVANRRGDTFDLAAKRSDIIKLVIYQSAKLPSDCARVRFHISKTGGFIHVVNAYDYMRTFDTLRAPAEVIRYFRYREHALSKFPQCIEIPEPALVGHFIGFDHEQPPTSDSASSLRALEDDSAAWDLAPLLSDFHKRLTAPDGAKQYYAILEELAKLPRSAWRAVKQRISKCIENVRADKLVQPYRIVCPDTACGFVFVPTTSELTQSADWPSAVANAVQNFTLAHKYDQKLDKCVGVMVSKSGEYFDIQWCLAEFHWEEDEEMQRRLDSNFPFRAVKDTAVDGYKFKDG